MPSAARRHRPFRRHPAPLGLLALAARRPGAPATGPQGALCQAAATGLEDRGRGQAGAGGRATGGRLQPGRGPLRGSPRSGTRARGRAALRRGELGLREAAHAPGVPPSPGGGLRLGRACTRADDAPEGVLAERRPAVAPVLRAHAEGVWLRADAARGGASSHGQLVPGRLLTVPGGGAGRREEAAAGSAGGGGRASRAAARAAQQQLQ
mmetsp:Transcript_59/g.210  ORF Transcript_59/g.210 Transcript_59/m.210 type:complete len:209 (-) Transcript_59:40-666(-)